jgi:copper chaperone
MIKFNVPDMSCGHCTAAIEKAVTGADDTAELAFDLEARTVTVTSALDETTLALLLEREGYPATIAG